MFVLFLNNPSFKNLSQRYDSNKKDENAICHGFGITELETNETLIIRGLVEEIMDEK